MSSERRRGKAGIVPIEFSGGSSPRSTAVKDGDQRVDRRDDEHPIITGKEPATSVGGFDQPDEGIGRGPLIRFLAAAGAPLGLEFSGDAWRSRVRTVLKGAPSQD